MKCVALATEDQLSEAVGKRLLTAASYEVSAIVAIRKNGAGYLRSKMKSWCEMATDSYPVVLLTDLDRAVCAPALIAGWLGGRQHPRDLVFRVAVREVEAWVLADHDAMRGLLGQVKLPQDPDALADAKAHLLGLAKQARREVRADLLPETGAVASQGLGYNARLCRLVEDDWNPDLAATRSKSLQRARVRIDELAKRHLARKRR